GLMLPISDWMMKALCRDLLAWNAAGGHDIKLSLNLSPQYLDRGDFFEKMRAALDRYGIRPGQIEVEITENICIRNPQYAIEQLNRICQLGVSVAIDDFGTGYSSLSYLKRFPVDIIKIDRSFVRDVAHDADDAAIVTGIIALAHSLRLEVVAEGVETQAQLNFLREQNCDLLQGYYLSPAVSAEQFAQLVRAREASLLRA
ncbi:MAG: EAL domain-containing protein, partial [Telluria sp.]|nr:EAL domain-containing protein [Telluria sp.]